MKSILSMLLACFCLVQISANNLNIIPRPSQVKEMSGSFKISPKHQINYSNASAGKYAKLLGSKINNILGFNLKVSDKSGTIQFVEDTKLKNEAYQLNIESNKIELKASSEAGWFYAVQTLAQLIEQAKANLSLKAMNIKDAPRFSWRAYMLDESRHFKGKEEVKLLLDEMAALKMNVFHWHLVDDQGWRIEIKKYPKLTEVGGTRKSTQAGPKRWGSKIQTGVPHSGYYTQEDIKEIVAYASERHINIVPEIEMPGHSSAAIAAYPWLGTAGQIIDVPTIFGVFRDVYDVSNPKVVEFLHDVLDEVFKLFPSQVVHIGGDEVKYDHWNESKKVKKYMKNKGLKTAAELQIYFTNNISQYFESKGRRMMGWNEIMGHNLHDYQSEEDTKTTGQELAKSSVVHFWKGSVNLLTEAAENGYQVVNSDNHFTYLDYKYTSISLQKAYSFDPIPADLDPKYHDKILGSGCQMWCEWVPTRGWLHFMTFPRIAAYAEVGWTQKENKDYAKFRKALTFVQKRWEERGIYYAPNSEVDPK